MVSSDSECVSSSVVDLMNYDGRDEWSISPSNCNLSDQMFSSFSMSNYPTNLSLSDGVNFMEDYISRRCQVGCDTMSFDGGTMTLQQMDMKFPFLIDSANGLIDLTDKRYKCPKKSNAVSNMLKSVIPRSPKPSLDEKMLKALHLCIEWFGRGSLAQVWRPIRNGHEYVLSTSEQPFIHDGTLSGYREVSKLFTFAAELGTNSLLGLPGRVFTSKVPEWTSNVMYYNEAEYLRVHHAVDHDIHGSIALPVFEDNLHGRSCCAVLELVTVEEKPNFDLEMENIYHALEAVDLSGGRPPWLSPQDLSSNQNTALFEIRDILCAICRAHQLPLALTWIGYSYTKNVDHNEHVKERNITPEIPILCLEKTACYWNDTDMEEFVHACADHFFEEGKCLVGKALQSNKPLFYPDIKKFHISEYPLVHHARKLGLSAVLAIRLKNTYTGDDDYILEFFLPVYMKTAVEQQLLLNNIFETMEMNCKSLSKVSYTELVEEKMSNVRLLNCRMKDISPVELPVRSFDQHVTNDELNYSERAPKNLYETTKMIDTDPPKKATVGFSKQMNKKRSTSEKHVSLSVLQQYFSGSLKDAAQSLGVCPTTLKRICRQHGISRWPSCKIKKVDRSLQKIQSMIESVPGMEGGLEFDPTKRGFVATFSVMEELNQGKNLFMTSKSKLVEQSDTVIQKSVTCEVVDVKKKEHLLINFPNNDVRCFSNEVDICDESKLAELDTGPSWPASLSTMPWMTTSKTSNISFLNKIKDSESHFVSGCSSSIIIDGEIDDKMIDENDEVTKHNKQAPSGMSNSSNESGSVQMMTIISSNSRSLYEKSSVRRETRYNGTKITVKVTYGENTVRFKFEPIAGCFELYSEVAKRFKLQIGEFQLKYLDDDEEWVLLVTDSDLLECIEVLDFLHTRKVKFLVDVPIRNSETRIINS
ncbi:hypothetical protein C2S51_027009 [Perilla frutescens var. frutescens]|nr:hypothetical protein C2S51_027009 [Perilla frutescens var. frutescens]